ncbi:DUF742 domain-containing protein [Nonomuraea sp. NPDC050556]|uniref:DUF742 domain-containing protein n=1 Tax=Nonomuraea sp. NPDC050556 TaxID=3364369 RepID=UPI0037899968
MLNDPDHRLPDPRMINVRYEQPARWPGAQERQPEIVESDGDVLRPFIITGGRTRPVDDRLRMETLVTAAPAALVAPLGFERGQIVRLCQRPLSVAEVSAALKVPIGVARVLIADLVSERLLVPHAHVTLGEVPSRDLLERIRDGVRSL